MVEPQGHKSCQIFHILSVYKSIHKSSHLHFLRKSNTDKTWTSTTSALRTQTTVITNMSKAATRRLQKEYKAIIENPIPLITAKPSESNILEWHYVLTGPESTPYEGGQYHGVLTFHKDYPFKPPSIMMSTPNGRFKQDTRICLSMSDYHPESWNPAWSVGTILQGLQSFMVDTEHATGCVYCTSSQIEAYCKASKNWNSTHNERFKKHFPELVSANLDDLTKNVGSLKI